MKSRIQSVLILIMGIVFPLSGQCFDWQADSATAAGESAASSPLFIRVKPSDSQPGSYELRKCYVADADQCLAGKIGDRYFSAVDLAQLNKMLKLVAIADHHTPLTLAIAPSAGCLVGGLGAGLAMSWGGPIGAGVGLIAGCAVVGKTVQDTLHGENIASERYNEMSTGTQPGVNAMVKEPLDKIVADLEHAIDLLTQP